MTFDKHGTSLKYSHEEGVVETTEEVGTGKTIEEWGIQ